MTKYLIKKSIEEGVVKESWDMIQQYEQECPYDPETIIMKSKVAVMVDDMEAACSLAIEGVRVMPYNPDAYYNYASVLEITNDIERAYEYYSKAEKMVSDGVEYSFDMKEVDKKIHYLAKVLADMEQKRVLNGADLEYLSFSEKVEWEFNYSLFHANADIIAARYYDYYEFPPFYTAFAKNMVNSFKNASFEEGQKCNTAEACAELQRITEITSDVELELTQNCYVPISAGKTCSVTISNESGKNVTIKLADKSQFYDLKFPKGRYSIKSDTQLNFGRRIPIGHKQDRKKAVVSIFVDGLAQLVIEDQMKELMPYTYKFFSNGVVCKKAYATGDWTLPSIASAFTGQTSANHRMIHPDKLHKIDLTTPLLSEYFMNRKYNTTKMGGNWRITPTYGYGRGFNRVLYQHGQCGFDIENVISCAIEQLYTMNDTDQFIWLEIGDLHAIADERMLSPIISSLPVMENGTLQESINSVKQRYDSTRERYYMEKIKFVDRKLAALYQYIEDNYEEDEVIVSLFSDHGQGYLVKDEKEFLGEARSKIALMTRGAGIKGECDEVISLCDYPEIMCKLAGMEYDNEYTDSNLPKYFGGEKEREFAVTETIHPGDPYRVVLWAKNYSFFLTGTKPVGDDCKVVLDEYTVALYDRNGEAIDNDELKTTLAGVCLERIASNMVYPDN